MGNSIKDNAWDGWRLIEVPTSIGGAQARASRRIEEKQKRQLEVLKIIAKSCPEVFIGAHGISISNSQVAEWQQQIQLIDSDNIYALRDRLNFLTRGLSNGQKMLMWDVSVPAPLTITHSETNPFTPNNFTALKAHRSWQQRIEEGIETQAFLDLLNTGNDLKGHRKLEAEYISWGLVMYYCITADCLLDHKSVNSLPIFSTTLTLENNDAWIELFDKRPEGLKRIPPRRRWMLSATTVGLILQHINDHGHPMVEDYDSAKAFAHKAWRQLHKACRVKFNSIASTLQGASLAYRFYIPSYLVNDAQGKSSGTSLSPNRWQQLIRGGARKLNKPEGLAKDFTGAHQAGASPSARKPVTRVSLIKSRQILAELKDKLYKRKSQPRLTYLEKSKAISLAIERATEAAPIIEYVCCWIQYLHSKKRKQSTLYNYINRVGFSLFQHLGNEQVDTDHIDSLRKAYEEIIDSAVSQNDRSYKLGLLCQFHDFLVEKHGIPSLEISKRGSDESAKQTLADANLLSEEEFECICYSLLSSACGEFSKAQYWIFVLGYRAGLRASEASSIQIRDLQLPKAEVPEGDFFLFVRPNRFVDTKSFDSRRQLPLHLLLSSQEREEFERYVRERKEMNSHASAMLFSSQADSTRPIDDSDIYPTIHHIMRAITGDSTLRYQHLRHSLANHLLIAFHDIAVPFSTPSHLKSLLDYLGHRITRKGLYFISQLLGHASPDTTLQSYIHCQSLLLQNFLKPDSGAGQSGIVTGRLSEEQQLKKALPMLRLNEAQIRQWKRRYGPMPILWLGKKFKRPGLYQVVKLDLKPYPKSQRIDTDPKRALATLTLIEIEKIISVAMKGWKPELIDKVFCLHEGSYQSFELAYARIVMVRTKTKNSTRPQHGSSKRDSYRHIRPYLYSASKKEGWQGHFCGRIISMPPPIRPTEQDCAKKIFEQISDQLSDPNLRSNTLKQLRFFYKSHRASESKIWIRDARAGIEFTRWITSLRGIQSNICLEIRPCKQSSLGFDEQISSWSKLLGSSAKKVHLQPGKMSHRFKSQLGTAYLSFPKTGREKNIGGAYGLRYALIMAIVLTFSSQKNGETWPINGTQKT